MLGTVLGYPNREAGNIKGPLPPGALEIPQPRVYHSLRLPDLGAGQNPAGNSDICFLPDHCSNLQLLPGLPPTKPSKAQFHKAVSNPPAPAVAVYAA